MVDSRYIMHHDDEHYFFFRSLRILESACTALFVFMIFVLGLFFLGNYQEFLDSSQNLLLNLLKFVSLLCAIFSLYYLVGLIIWMVRRRHILFLRVTFAVVSLGLAGTLSLGVNFILVILEPVLGGPGA